MNKEQIEKYRKELEGIIHKYLAGEIEYNYEMTDLLDDMEDRMMEDGEYSIDNPMEEGCAESRIMDISAAIKSDIELAMESPGDTLKGLLDNEEN